MKKNLPLLSIIIPVYNTSKFLNRCLDSVIRQTYSEIEIIIVNDGSPDDSEEIILDYVSRYSNVKYVKNDTNEGLFQARLRGYEKASGAYIASLDSDDFVGFDYYRTLMAKAIESAADIVISNMTIYYQKSGKKTQRTYGNYAIRDIDLYGKDIQKAYFSMDAEVSQWWFVWNKVYKREVWDRCYATLKAYEGHHIMLEDFVYGTVFMTHVNHVVSIESDTYYYVRHEEASTGSGGGAAKIRKNVNDILDAFFFLNKYLGEECNTEDGIQFINKACRRWKKTWLSSTSKAAIAEEEKREIIAKLNEIPVEVNNSQYDDIYAGYFYRELNSCIDENNQIKEYLKDSKIKLLCIEAEDVLFDKLWDLEETLKNVERKWKKNNNEDISEIIFLRKWSERTLSEKGTGIYKYNKPSLEEIYGCIKKNKNQVFNQLVDCVRNLEEEVRMTNIFLSRRMDEVISFAQWLDKEIVLIDTSGICGELFKDYKVYTLDKNKSMVSELCSNFKCDASEIMYLGTDKYVDLSKLGQMYNVQCYKIKSIHDMGSELNLNKSLENDFMIDSRQAGSSNCIKELLVNIVSQKAFYRNVKDSIFASDPYLIGAVVGSHAVSVIGWLLNIARRKEKKNICFWGNSVDIYYKLMRHASESRKILGDITISIKSFSDVERALQWVIYPETFTKQDAVEVSVSVSELFDEIDAFIGELYENILLRYGLKKEDIIDNYEICEKLHHILAFEFDVIPELEKEYFSDVDEKELIVYADNSAEKVLGRYVGRGIAFASIYPYNQMSFLEEKDTYYSRERIINYPIRTFFVEDIFVESLENRYLERFVTENIKKGVLYFADTYFDMVHEDFDDYLPFYSEQDSYYYEMLLSFPKNNDRLLFDAVERDDYGKKNKRRRLLSNIWWEVLDYNHLIKKKEPKNTAAVSNKNVSNKIETKQTLDKTAVYYGGKKISQDKLSRFERWLVYWVFDEKKINYKVQKYLSSRILLRPLLCIFGRKIKPNKHCLYIATSNYNLLCCIIHKLKYNADQDCDLILSTWRKDKVGALKSEKIFKNIYISEDNHFRNLTWDLDKKIESASDKEKDYLVEGFYDRFFDELPVNIFEYKHILATNTIMPITVLLQKLHIRYDCVEEAAGLYSNNELLMNNMQSYHPKSEVYALEKYKMLNMDYVKGKRFVNISAQEPGYSRKHVVDFNVVSELKKMDKDKRAKVLHVFSSTEAIEGEQKASCLILTYPLSTRSGLTEKEHIEVYRLLMDIFCKDKVVHFKPHPDDKVDYNKYFGNERDFRLINKQILSELLEFETKTYYQKAITTVSTSTNNLQNCGEKIVFGKEFEKDYKYLLLCYGYYLVVKELCQAENYTLYLNGVSRNILENIFNYSNGADKKYTFGGDYQDVVNELKSKIIVSREDIDCAVIKANDVVIVQDSHIDYAEVQKSHVISNVVMRIEGREDYNRYVFKLLLPCNIIQLSELNVFEKMPRSGYKIFISQEK